MSTTALDTRRMEEILDLARRLGLDFFDIKFEVIPAEVMTEIAAYGLPIRAAHWSHGKVYNRLRIHGRMGMSRIYEIIINNDPGFAFLLDSNRDVDSLLITAHVAAHVDFFKHNASFRHTDRNMVNKAADHAARIGRYRERHGIDKVEKLMDIAFAIDRHIDVHKGLHRKPYPGRTVEMREKTAKPYADIWNEEDYSMEEVVKGGRIPPHPERDLLWFLIQYAPIDDWEGDVLGMIREESYYFYPQFTTKIINEGWASFWHAEIINQYDGISPPEMLDFSKLHSSVVSPGHPLQVNPYYLGYRILKDIEERFGREKLFAVREEDDDFSLIRNYLTEDLCEDLQLFRYGPACRKHTPPDPNCADCRRVIVEDRAVEPVREGLLRSRYNYGTPRVAITGTRRGSLQLEQLDRHDRGLDRQYAEQTLGYLHQIWQAPVELLAASPDGKPLELVCDHEGVRQRTKR